MAGGSFEPEGFPNCCGGALDRNHSAAPRGKRVLGPRFPMPVTKCSPRHHTGVPGHVAWDNPPRSTMGGRVAATNPYLEAQLRPGLRGGDGHRTACARADPRDASAAGTCATGPIPSSLRIPRPTTGSPVTAWCTASRCATVGPSGTGTAGSGPSTWPRHSAKSAGPDPRRTATWTSVPTRTSSGTPVGPSRSSRPGPGRTS